MPSPSGTRCWPLVSTARSSRAQRGIVALSTRRPASCERRASLSFSSGQYRSPCHRQTFQPANPPSRYNRGMPVRLIALDIDGTLLDSRWQVSEANRQAIAQAARRGIEVALVTGRRYDFAMPVARQLQAPLTMIVNNGALVRSNDGHTHLRHLLPRHVAKQVLPLTKPWREGTAVIFDRPLENQLMLERLDPDDSLRYAYYSRNKEFIGLSNPLESCLTEDPIQVMLSGKVASMRDAERALRGKHHLNGVFGQAA